MAISLKFIGIVKSAGIVAATGTPNTPEGSLVNDRTFNELILDFIASLSGSYTAGGDPLDFTAAAPSGYQLPAVAPSDVKFDDLATIGTAAPGYVYKYAYGPNLQSPTPQGGAMQIFGTGTASQDGLNEIAAGAYSSASPSLNNAQIKIRATFAKAA